MRSAGRAAPGAAGFGSDAERVHNRARVNAVIGDGSHAHHGDWTERLLKAGVPCGPIYTVDRMFDDPQVRHLGMARPAASGLGRDRGGWPAHAVLASPAQRGAARTGAAPG